MRARSIKSALAALALVAAASSLHGRLEAETRPRYGRTLTATLLGKPAVFDPHAATSHADVTLAGLVFDSLYRIDDKGEVVPELATALPFMSEDRLELTIPIRIGAFFHDGETLTSADVVASLVRLKAGAAGWLVGSLDSVTASETGGEVVLRLRYPAPGLAASLASPIAAITRGGKTPSSRRAIGTGPFRLRSIDRRRREVRLAAFDKHHRGRAYLDGLRLRWYDKQDDEARAYELGELQMSLRGDVAFPGHQPKYKTSSSEGGAAIMAYVGFGTANRAILEDTEFRRSLSLALNRDSITKVGTGEHAYPSVRPDSRGSGAPVPSPSESGSQIEAAKVAFAVAAARVAALRNLSRVNLEILVNRSRLDDIDVADKVLAALDKLGVRATVLEVSAEVFAKRVQRGACDLYIGQSAAPVADQRVEIAAAFAAGDDDWARSALRSAPLDLASAVSEFRRRLPIIPLFHRAVRAHFRSDVIGLAFDGSAQIEWADLSLFGSAKVN